MLSAPPASGAPSTPPPLVEYRVRRGDTLQGVARRLYGDPRRIDLILRHNDLGPPPHRLRAGQILRVPPDAWLAFVGGRVEVHGPERRVVGGPVPLQRGDRVSTFKHARAAVEFSDSTRAVLEEHSVLLVAGADAGQVPGLRTANDTTLLAGSLRVTGPVEGLAVIATPWARVELRGGDGLVRVDGTGRTRLAVHEGQWRVTAAGRTVTLRGGQGTLIDRRAAPQPPRDLPGPPQWTSVPAPILFMLGGTVQAQGSFHAGGGPPPAMWRVQIAQDDRFASLVVDSLQPAAEDRLVAHGLAPGVYFARVAALDDDQFEGPPSAAVRFEVVEVRILEGGKGEPARLSLPQGLFCGLDGAELAAVHSPLPLIPGRAHLLRCAATPGGRTSELRIDARQAGLPRHRTEVGPLRQDGGWLRRQVLLRLSDPAGRPLTGLRVLARPEGDMLAGAVREVEPGAYAVEVAWPWGRRPGMLHFDVGADEEIAVLIRAAPPPLEPAPPPVTRPPARPPRPRPPALPSTPAAQPAPSLLLADRTVWDLSVGATVLFSDPAQGPFGRGLLLGFGRRFPLSRGALSIGLRAQVEDFSYHPGVRTPCASDGGSPAMLCIRSREGDFAYLFARAALTLSIPLTYHLRAADRAIVPYLGLAPLLVLDWRQSQVLGLPNRVRRTEHAGLVALAGLSLRPWRARWGSLLVEAGYRHVGLAERRRNDASLGGFLLMLGFRAEH